MRQTLCKRFLLLFINLFIWGSLAIAQDSSKVTAPSPSKATAKPVVQKSPTKAVVKSPTVKPADTTVTKAGPPIIAKPSDNSINGQYENLLRYSWMQKGYRVVNSNNFNSFWKSVSDTLRNNRKELVASQLKLDELEKQLNEPTNISPEKTTVSTNKIEVFGMLVDATTYNWVVLGTILALALALGIVVFTTTKSGVDSKHHKQLYEEISSEYNTYKAKSKEKESKLARELQTERNTIEELKARNNVEDNTTTVIPPKRPKKQS